MNSISVVIPAYNVSKTIAETLNSLLAQTYEDFEVIIVNDGSTDNTVEIVTNFCDSRIKLISQENTGVSAARNRGVSCANGEYLSFLDADDIWMPDKLKEQVEALEENPEAAVAYSWTKLIDISGNTIDTMQPNYSGRVYSQLLQENFLHSGSNVLIRRDAFVRVGGFNESMSHSEDYDCFLRLAKIYPFAVVKKPHVWYRIYSGSTTSQALLEHEQKCKTALEYFFSQAPEDLQHLKKQNLANLYQYLSLKAVESNFTKTNSYLSGQYYWRALKLNPSLFLTNPITVVISSIKLTLGLILPASFFTSQIIIGWRSSVKTLLNSKKQ